MSSDSPTITLTLFTIFNTHTKKRRMQCAATKCSINLKLQYQQYQTKRGNMVYICEGLNDWF